MNDTTPPPGTPGASDQHDRADQPRSPRTSDRFFTWLRDLGISRSSDRWLTGVAGGIAAKANIDPLIVRGVFVVLAVLGGPGILLYLAAWLLLPDSTGRIHLEDLFRGRASAGAIATAVVLGVILVIPAIIWMFRTLFFGPWGWNTWDFVPDWVQVTFGVLWWAVLVPALAIWLIVWLNGRGVRGSASATTTGSVPKSFSEQASEFSAQASDFADRTGKRANEWGEEFGQKAEAWGHRVEEKSKEWEQRGREYHEAHRLGAAHVVITLALALLAGGVGAGWALMQQANGNLVLTAGLVSGVAVLAISTIIAGIRGRNSGWVGFLSFCGVIALLFAPVTAVLPKQTSVIPFGQSSVHPSAGGGDRAVITIGGNATVDLRDLRSDAAPRTIDVWVLAGNTAVILPDEAPTRIQVNLLAGNIRDNREAYGDRRESGILLSQTIEHHSAGIISSDLVEVRVRMLGGNATIEDGDRVKSSDRSPSFDDRENEISQLEERIKELESAR